MRHFIKHLKGTLKHLPKYDQKQKPNKCLEQQINQNKGGQSITNFIVTNVGRRRRLSLLEAAKEHQLCVTSASVLRRKLISVQLCMWKLESDVAHIFRGFYLFFGKNICGYILTIFKFGLYSIKDKTQDSFEKIRKIRKVYRDIKSGFVSKKFINNFLDFFKNLKLLCVYLLS
jgi:hypothetical protein